jgi:hypothetical protein
LLSFAQNASAASGLKAHERRAASVGEGAMPPADRVVVRKTRLGDLLEAQAAVEQRLSIRALRRPMRPDPSRPNAISAKLSSRDRKPGRTMP